MNQHHSSERQTVSWDKGKYEIWNKDKRTLLFSDHFLWISNIKYPFHIHDSLRHYTCRFLNLVFYLLIYFNIDVKTSIDLLLQVKFQCNLTLDEMENGWLEKLV